MLRLFFSLLFLAGAIHARGLCELSDEDGLRCECRDTQAFCEATRPLESLVPAVHKSPTENAKRRREARTINTLTLQSPMNESFLQNFPKDIFDEPLQFKKVNIAHAELSTLRPYTVYGSEYIKELTLSFCGIKNFQRKAITGLLNLLKLDLSNNEVQVFKTGVLSALPSLQELYIAHSPISDVEPHAFVELTSLKRLSLKDNALKYIDNLLFTGLKELEFLDLSFNYLREMDNNSFEDLPKLREVDLSGNNLMVIHPDTFKGMKALERLALNYNNIHFLPEGFLKDSRNLNHLDLSRNNLKTVTLDTFRGLRVVRSNFILDVRMNPLNCSCDLYFLKELNKRRLAGMEDGLTPAEYDTLQCQRISRHSIEPVPIETTVYTNDSCQDHPELAQHKAEPIQSSTTSSSSSSEAVVRPVILAVAFLSMISLRLV